MLPYIYSDSVVYYYYTNEPKNGTPDGVRSRKSSPWKGDVLANYTTGALKMAGEGIEPSIFALWAQRLNRLSILR